MEQISRVKSARERGARIISLSRYNAVYGYIEHINDVNGVPAPPLQHALITLNKATAALDEWVCSAIYKAASKVRAYKSSEVLKHMNIFVDTPASRKCRQSGVSEGSNGGEE